MEAEGTIMRASAGGGAEEMNAEDKWAVAFLVLLVLFCVLGFVYLDLAMDYARCDGERSGHEQSKVEK